MKRQSHFSHPKLGFTLIELLITMSILGILATIGFGSFQSSRLKAADAKKKSDLTTISKSLEAYVNDHRTYPTSDSLGQIICQPPSTPCSWGESFQDDKGTVYTATLPTPATAYIYVSNGASYTLYTRLENQNDQAITTFSPEVTCDGSNLCNYKITSSNIQ